LIERLVKHDEERTAREFASLEEEFGELEEFDDSKINLE
jgi:SAP domain-containing ribonucleoprotein